MKILRVNTKGLNLRSEPSRKANITGLLKRGEIVKVLQFSPQYYWVQIQRQNNQIGWSAYKYFLGIPNKGDVRQNDYRWLKNAYGELNTPELPDPKENHRITQYLNTCELSLNDMDEDSDETPWCSAFANWCIENAGYQGTNSAWALSWKDFGKKVNPKRGVLAVFRRYYTKRGIKKMGGHVGFYLRKDPDRQNRIILLGGNQGAPGFVIERSYPIRRDTGKYDGYELVDFRLPYTKQTSIE